MLALFLIETKDKKHDSDYMYIKAFLEQFYVIGNNIKLQPIYFVNVNLILYKKWKIILYNFQLFAGWFSRNARLSFSLYDGPLMETTDE